MAANVALSDTFDQWRVKTNQVLAFTQATGGADQLYIANTTETTSNTVGALIVDGGIGVAKSLTLGKNITVFGNSTFKSNVIIGDDENDNITFNALVNSHLKPDASNTYTLGNNTLKFASLYVEGFVGANSTTSLTLPSGTSAQRGGGAGAIRYNTELNRFEGNTGTVFQPLGLATDTDGDTRIGVEDSADEDTLRFFTGNSSNLSTEIVNFGPNGGNVGIGTGSSHGDAKLQVVGTANISGVVTLGNVLNAEGNVFITGANVYTETVLFLANSTTVHVKGNTTTIQSNTTNITGNTTSINGSQFDVISNTSFTGANVYIDGTQLTVLSNTNITGANVYIDGTTATITSNVSIISSTFTSSADNNLTGANTYIDGTQLTVVSNTNLIGANTYIDGTQLTVTSNSNFTGANTYIDGTQLTVTSNSNFTGANTYIDGTQLTVTSNSNFTGANTYINGTNLTILSNTVVNGITTFNNTVVIDQALTVNSTAEITGNLLVGGNLTVTGSTVSISSQNLSVDDNKIYLNGGNTSWSTSQITGSGSPSVQFSGQYEGNANTEYRVKIVSTNGGSGGVAQAQYSADGGATYGSTFDVSTTTTLLSNGIKVTFSATTGYTLNDTYAASVVTVNVDIGWTGNYNDGTYSHAGIFRDATDGHFKMFDQYTPEPDDQIDINTGHASFHLAPLDVGLLNTANLAVTSTFTFNSLNFTGTQYFAIYNANNTVVSSGYLLTT